MTSPTSLRLAARLARREVRRRPWRTVLVALLVALPVAGMTVAVGFVRTDRYDAVEGWRTTWGSATDVGFNAVAREALGVSSDAPDANAVLGSLPAGSRVTSWRSAHSLLRTVERRRASAEVLDLALAGPVGDDVFQITRGRAPAAPDEAFLSRDLAKELGVEVGEVVDFERPERVSWRVVGVGERRAYWGSFTAVLGPGAAFPWDRTRDVGTATNYAVDVPDGVTRAQLRVVTTAFGTESLAPHLRARMPVSESKTREVAWSWVIGAIVLTVVGIVIASAFAAGARRQLTTLGQLAANGAAPTVLRGVLFLQGTWTGVIGAALGLVLGGAGLMALAPHADRLLGRDVRPWDVRVIDLVPVVLLGIAAATVAALIPARTTVRVPVLAALAGRRSLTAVPRWVTAAGGVGVLAGLGLLGLAVLGGREATDDTELWALTAILGGMGVLLGACAMTPGYTSVLEPLAGRIGGAWRLAARSLARQRTRTSAVVAGVCAASALAVGASAMLLSADAEDRSRRDMMRPDEVHVLAEMTTLVGTVEEEGASLVSEPAAAPRDLVEKLRAAVPGAEVLELLALRPPTGLRWNVDQLDVEEPSGDGPPSLFDHGPGSMSIAVFDRTAERVYELSAAHRAVVEKEGVLLLGGADGAGEVSLIPAENEYGEAMPRGAAKAAGRSVAAPPTRHSITVVDGSDYALGSLPRLLMTPAAVDRLALRLVPRPPIAVVRAPEPLTRAQVTLVSDIIEEYHLDTTSPVSTSSQLNVFTETLYPVDGLDPLLLEAILSGAALLFSLFVVAVSLALAAAETRDERDVLTVVGAPPETMWGTSGRKAALLTALGGVLAVPVGFLPVVVFNLAGDPTPPLVFPWRVTLLLLVAVPLLAGVATTAASAVALRMRPVRISTMAFD